MLGLIEAVSSNLLSGMRIWLKYIKPVYLRYTIPLKDEELCCSIVCEETSVPTGKC